MPDKIRLILIDDHILFREGLARLLNAEQELNVAGQFSSGEEAIEALREDPADVVLLDYDLGGNSNGFHFLRTIRAQGFTAKVLLVTAGLTSVDMRKILAEGAAGIFLKHNPPADLIRAISRIAQGETWIDPSTLSQLATMAPSQPKPKEMPAISGREQAVLNAVFEGFTNKEIAARLDISESYVKAILQQLFEKTGVRTRSQLVRVALERQIR